MSSALKWILAIVALLGGNVVMMVVLAVAANSGDAQVIPDYYAQATRYDETMAEASHSRALGWTAAATLTGSTLEITVLDADGHPLDGAHVAVAGYQRAHADGRYALELAPTGPGTYQGALADARVGVHDLALVVAREDQRFTTQLVVEAR